MEENIKIRLKDKNGEELIIDNYTFHTLLFGEDI